MTLQMLRCFATVARTLSFAEAANQLYITQPAVSHQIQLLENELGIKLLDRTRHHVSLTPAGISFYNDITDILERINLATDHIQTINVYRETLNIGFQSTIQLRSLPDIYRIYNRSYPDVYINNVELNIVNGEIEFPHQLDVAFITKDYAEIQKEFHYETLYKGRFCCVLPIDHHLAKYQSLSITDLGGETLILLDSVHCPPEMDQIQKDLKKNCSDVKFFLSSSSLYTATMIEAGLGIAVMPDFICPFYSNVAMVPFEITAIPEFGLAWHAKSKQDKVKYFIETTRKVFRSQNVITR